MGMKAGTTLRSLLEQGVVTYRVTENQGGKALCLFYFIFKEIYLRILRRTQVRFERTTRHPRRKVKLARSLELRESGWARDINLAFISIKMIFKALRADEITYKKGREKREGSVLYCKNFRDRSLQAMGCSYKILKQGFYFRNSVPDQGE